MACLKLNDYDKYCIGKSASMIHLRKLVWIYPCGAYSLRMQNEPFFVLRSILEAWFCFF